MAKDIDNHVKACPTACTTCQNVKAAAGQPEPTSPNDQINIDLYSPLQVEEGGHKYVVVITDAFTKMVCLAVIEKKMADPKISGT